MTRCCALVFVLFLVAVSPAGAVDVSQLSDFSADPCFVKLNEGNTAQHVDAPASALVDACERAHASPEVAWDFLTRTWLPREVTAASTYRAAVSLSAGGLAVAIGEMLLIYAVLGVWVWPLVLSLWPASAPTRPRRSAPQVALCLVLRVLLGGVLLAVLSVPGATLLASLAVLALVALHVRPTRRGSVARDTPPASAVAVFVAGVINDTAAAAPGLLALAVVARGHWWLLLLGVLAAIPASVPAVVRARQALTGMPVALAGAGVLLAAGAGALVTSDPALSGLSTATLGALAYLIPLGFAGVVLWRARVADLSPIRRVGRKSAASSATSMPRENGR